MSVVQGSDDELPPGASPALVARAHAVVDPLRRLLERDAAQGVALIVAAALAMVWANLPGAGYDVVWTTELRVAVAGAELSTTARELVNDGLMVVFFFLVGLEIRSELHDGELSDRRRAAVPAVAAIGGVLAPIAIYLAINGGGPGRDGWAVPMATDIAFALGVLLLLGRSVPSELRAILLGLAIVDDVMAILVIAIFYHHGGELIWLLAMAGGVGLILVLQKLGVRRATSYVPAGVLIWIGAVRAGIHPTIAGVIIGVLTPTRAWLGPDQFGAEVRGRLDELDAQRWAGRDTSGSLAAIAAAVRKARSPVERLIDRLDPIVGFVIVPVFALANAGVRVTDVSLGDDLAIAAGVTAGLLIGKPLGVFGAVWLAVRLGIATLPQRVSHRDVLLLGVVAAIGLTMSLFIAQLAFGDDARGDAARLAVLVASTIAGLAAYALGRVRTSSPRSGRAGARPGPG